MDQASRTSHRQQKVSNRFSHLRRRVSVNACFGWGKQVDGQDQHGRDGREVHATVFPLLGQRFGAAPIEKQNFEEVRIPFQRMPEIATSQPNSSHCQHDSQGPADPVWDNGVICQRWRFGRRGHHEAGALHWLPVFRHSRTGHQRLAADRIPKQMALSG